MVATISKQRGLGRGLSALLGEEGDSHAVMDGDNLQITPRGYQEIDITKIRPNKNQPRQHFFEADINDLTSSIKEKGVIQPILVKPAGDDSEIKYEIIAGERRWRAAKRAGLNSIPVIIREHSELESLELAIIENIQRENLTPIEEAEAYDRLIKKFDYNQDRVASKVGKSRSHVANLIRLLELPPAIKNAMREGKLTMGHARAMLSSSDPAAMFKRITTEGLSVRETEDLIRAEKPITKHKTASSGKVKGDFSGVSGRDSELVKEAFESTLGLKTRIISKGQGGTIIMDYKSAEELQRALSALGY